MKYYKNAKNKAETELLAGQMLRLQLDEKY